MLEVGPFCLITFSALEEKATSLSAVVAVLKYHAVIIMMLELNVQVHYSYLVEGILSNNIATYLDHVNATIPCADGDLRLVGGMNESEGRVEICISNQWGTVCRNSWSVSDAKVVCRQLGFSALG